MMTPDTRNAWYQHALMLALVACVLRALIPVGFMPDFSTPGHMVICSETAMVKTIDVNPADHAAKKTAHDVCGFAVNGTGLAAQLDMVKVPSFASITHVWRGVQSPSVYAASSYASRAPPVVL